MIRIRIAGIGLALLVLGLSPEGLTEPVKDTRLTLITTPAKAKGAEQIALIDNLIRTRLKTLGFVRHQYSPLFEPTALVDARAILQASRLAMNKDHNLQRAAEHELLYNRALLAFRGALAAATTTELAEVHTALATTRLKAEDRRLAADYLSTAMLLVPEMKETDLMGQTATRDLFRELRSEWSARERGTLEVETKRRGVEVYKNDVLVGYTPLTLRDLPVGSHLIRLRQDGFYSAGQFVQIRAGQKTQVNQTLKPVAGRGSIDKALKVLRRKRWSKRKTAAIEAASATIKRLLRTDALLVLSISKTKKGFRLLGANALHSGKTTQIAATLAADSQLLSAVKALVESWSIRPNSGLKAKDVTPVKAEKKTVPAQESPAVDAAASEKDTESSVSTPNETKEETKKETPAEEPSSRAETPSQEPDVEPLEPDVEPED